MINLDWGFGGREEGKRRGKGNEFLKGMRKEKGKGK